MLLDSNFITVFSYSVEQEITGTIATTSTTACCNETTQHLVGMVSTEEVDNFKLGSSPLVDHYRRQTAFYASLGEKMAGQAAFYASLCEETIRT